MRIHEPSPKSICFLFLPTPSSYHPSRPLARPAPGPHHDPILSHSSYCTPRAPLRLYLSSSTLLGLIRLASHIDEARALSYNLLDPVVFDVILVNFADNALEVLHLSPHTHAYLGLRP